MKVQTKERRSAVRFDKAFHVYLSGDDGISRGIARNISEGGMFVETSAPCPIGSRVQITFVAPGSSVEIAMWAVVRYQCFLSYGNEEGEGLLRGMGLRFIEPIQFEEAMPELAQAQTSTPALPKPAPLAAPLMSAGSRVLH
ncbi:MAG: PilZ domain-containing protein [Myxococcales bacterium]|jgi:hypothetical protein|nr:PilZ domain-containing protein [Myxococcales bacterium]